MALPSSGPLSLYDIGTYIGYSAPYSLSGMGASVGFSAPYAVSDFYGFTYVDIDTYYPSTATCFNYVTFAAQASETVSTDVNVTMYWYGDLGGTIIATVTIYTGTSCNSLLVYTGGDVNCAGENYTSDNNSISPGYYGVQHYRPGTVYVGSPYPC